MRSGKLLDSREREKPKVNINLYPVEVHSLQRRYYENFTKSSFKTGDFTFHKNKSQVIQTCTSISNTFLTIPPRAASTGVFATVSTCGWDVCNYVSMCGWDVCNYASMCGWVFATIFSSVHPQPLKIPKGNFYLPLAQQKSNLSH